MFTIENFTTFLGWCSVINIGLLAVSALAIVSFMKPISALHSKMFGLDEKDMPMLYFRYLGNYKVATLVFNLVPYIALRVAF